MRALHYFFMVLISFVFANISKISAQEITEEDKNSQEQRLKEEPRDFAANFIVGAYYYNLASNPHLETTQMTLPQYLDSGSSLERKKEEYLKKALPYFENAYAIKKDDRVKEVLKNIYRHLGLIKMQKTNEKQIQAELEARLNTIIFKPIE